MGKTESKKLQDKIWLTRKCRINASERLLRKAVYIESLNVWYSTCIIIMSLISYIRKNNDLSLLSLVLSIGLIVSIVYVNATGLRDRSFALKQNYIDLQLLLLELESDTDTKHEHIKKKYGELLKSSENHLPIDMYHVKMRSADLRSEIYWGGWFAIIWHFVWTTLLKCILIVLPVCLFLVFALKGDLHESISVFLSSLL